MGMDQYLLIPFLGGWTSIYQLFWCSPGVPRFWHTAIYTRFHCLDIYLAKAGSPEHTVLTSRYVSLFFSVKTASSFKAPRSVPGTILKRHLPVFQRLGHCLDCYSIFMYMFWKKMLQSRRWPSRWKKQVAQSAPNIWQQRALTRLDYGYQTNTKLFSAYSGGRRALYTKELVKIAALPPRHDILTHAFHCDNVQQQHFVTRSGDPAFAK